MILITGGAGYIGSHLAYDLINRKQDVIIVDGLLSANKDNIYAINKLLKVKIKFIKCNLLDSKRLENIFKKNKISTIFHLAGFKSINESIKNPLKYYQNNINCTLNILSLAKKYKINKIIYSSSATVYGSNAKVPYSENSECFADSSPYAMSKLISEKLLYDFHEANKFCKIAILRYFNPIGTHNSGKIGYDYTRSTNLIPNIIKILLNKNKKLKIFGDNYKTRDGTGVRDYIHIDDLIRGHLLALKKIKMNNGYNVWNLGTGQGHSVLEVVKMFEKVLCKKINYTIVKNREGDLSHFWCSTKKAEKELNWKAKKNLTNMIRDEINFFNSINKF